MAGGDGGADGAWGASRRGAQACRALCGFEVRAQVMGPQAYCEVKLSERAPWVGRRAGADVSALRVRAPTSRGHEGAWPAGRSRAGGRGRRPAASARPRFPKAAERRAGPEGGAARALSAQSAWFGFPCFPPPRSPTSACEEGFESLPSLSRVSRARGDANSRKEPRERGYSRRFRLGRFPRCDARFGAAPALGSPKPLALVAAPTVVQPQAPERRWRSPRPRKLSGSG